MWCVSVCGRGRAHTMPCVVRCVRACGGCVCVCVRVRAHNAMCCAVCVRVCVGARACTQCHDEGEGSFGSGLDCKSDCESDSESES